MTKLPISGLLEQLEQSGAIVGLEGATLRTDNSQYRGDMSLLHELSARRLEAIGHLAAHRPRPPLPAFSRVDTPGFFPLTAAQEYWADPEIPPNDQWVTILLRMEGKLDIAALQHSYSTFVDRHEAFRTRYLPHGSELVQAADSSETRQLEIVDLDGLSPELAELEVYRRMKAHLSGETLLQEVAIRLALYRLSADSHLLGGHVHHIGFDAQSYGIFTKELVDGYFNRAGLADLKKEAPLQHRHYAAWERTWLGKTEKDLAQAYWEHSLAGAEAVVFPQSARSDEAADPVPCTTSLEHEELLAAKDFAQIQGVTLRVYILTVLAVVFARTTGRSRLVFGQTINGRPAGFEDVIGCFMQIRPFFMDFSRTHSISELLTYARTTVSSSQDLRRPVPRELLARLNFGRVLVNYRTAQSTAPRNSQLTTTNTRRSGGEADDVPLQGAVANSASFQTTSVQTERPPSSLRRPPALSISIGRLPLKLKSRISRDLFFGIHQDIDKLTITISRSGCFSSQDMRRLCDEIHDVMTLMQSGEATIASLISPRS